MSITFSQAKLKAEERREILQAIQTQMAVRYFKGESLENTLAWASGELEGFMRN